MAYDLPADWFVDERTLVRPEPSVSREVRIQRVFDRLKAFEPERVRDHNRQATEWHHLEHIEPRSDAELMAEAVAEVDRILLRNARAA